MISTSVGDWVLTHTIETIYGFALVTILLAPLAMKVRNWFNPRSPGGLGDLPDEKGVPAHVRLAQHDKVLANKAKRAKK